MERPNKYKRARIQKGYTQEKAAELLFISVETLSNYENDKYNPPTAIVKQMIIIYDYTQLALDYFFDSELGEYLPVVKEKELRDAIINLVVALNGFDQEKKNKMLEIANNKDLKKEEFNDKFLEQIDDLINAASEVKFCK